MHELLAPIVYVQFHHSTRKSLSASQHAAAANGGVKLSPDALQLFQAIGDPQFAAHDSFTLFERLMVRVKQWYSTDKPSTTASSSSRISTASTDPWNEDPFRPLFNRHKQPQPPAVEDGEKV
jgi:hypothetical protein